MRAREFTKPQAAGCILIAADTGRWCLQQRSDTVSDPGIWSTWGGGREPGESLEQCVRRELAEEGGYTGPLKLEPLMMNQRYATYIGHVPHEFDPQINNEVKDWCWVEPDDLPNPLHAGLEQALSKLNENFADGKVKGTELKNSIPTGLYFDIDDVSVNQLYRGLGIGALLYKLVITCIARLNPKVKGLLSPRKNRLSTATNVSKIYSQLGGKVGINGAKDIYDLLPIKNYITLEVEPQPGAQIAAISGKNISFLVDEAGPYRVVLTVFDHNTMKPIGFISATASFWDSETETLDNENISENFADGKVKGKSRPGRVKRSGASCNGSVSSLRAKARKYGGERGKMYHWCANMKGGKKK
jgi:8-oxo-dGTP pyrophosphatase MutT (NUDIX family)